MNWRDELSPVEKELLQQHAASVAVLVQELDGNPPNPRALLRQLREKLGTAVDPTLSFARLPGETAVGGIKRFEEGGF